MIESNEKWGKTIYYTNDKKKIKYLVQNILNSFIFIEFLKIIHYFIIDFPPFFD